MHITNFEAENIKRISAVNITPDGNMVILGGNNKQGKSSCLDAIAYAIGGKKLIPDEPLRSGADKGKVSVTLSGKNEAPLIVTREFSKKGTTSLTITSGDGKKVTSPQTILDNLIGAFTLDPHVLLNAAPKEQLKMVKDVVKIDFTELDIHRERIYQERTFVNREISQLSASLADTYFDETIPKHEVDISDLTIKLNKATQENNDIASKKQMIIHAHNEIQRLENELSEIKSEISILNDKKNYTEQVIYDQNDNIKIIEKELSQKTEHNINAIIEEINGANEVNRLIQYRNESLERLSQLNKKEEKSKLLTDEIAVIDDQKMKMIKNTKWPVDGLSFDENGLRLNGLPFDQASQAEQLETAIALALAENPTLRVIWIKDASLMDHKSLRLMATIAEKYDAQIWLERTSLGKECSVILTDGHIASEAETELLRLEENA